MSHQQQCNRLMVLLVLDLRDHTKNYWKRLKPPDDSRSWGEIAIVVALSHSYPNPPSLYQLLSLSTNRHLISSGFYFKILMREFSSCFCVVLIRESRPPSITVFILRPRQYFDLKKWHHRHLWIGRSERSKVPEYSWKLCKTVAGYKTKGKLKKWPKILESKLVRCLSVNLINPIVAVTEN